MNTKNKETKHDQQQYSSILFFSLCLVNSWLMQEQPSYFSVTRASRY